LHDLGVQSSQYVQNMSQHRKGLSPWKGSLHGQPDFTQVWESSC
jgi:hypothetical protein